MPPSEGCQRTPCSTIQFRMSLDSRDHELGQFLVGLPAGHAQQIVPELLLGVGAGEDLGRGIVGAAHVAGVAGVAAAIELRRAFQHQHGRARAPGADRGAQRGVAAADHQHIEFFGQIGHALLLSLLAWKSNRRSARQIHPPRRFSSLLQRPRHASRARTLSIECGRMRRCRMRFASRNICDVRACSARRRAAIAGRPTSLGGSVLPAGETR